MRKLIFTLFISLCCGLVMAQTTVSGVIIDASTNEPLIGANVMNTGTLDGTITDVDGTFTLDVPENSGELEVSFVGYQTMTISFESSGGSYDLGSISAQQSTVGLEEVVITGTMDIVQDRRTPVAVSTISRAEIQAKGGNVEFPDIMKATPSIYVAGQAGGYGDSEVFTRGFDQTNTAFLLNGQPINGMEDGKMYWSNWSGMSDVASAVQVQRGLGSSKLAISSVGGTTNIIMKSTEQQRGGSLSYLLGNDGYNKVTASYNTGMVDGKFGLTVLLTHWQGNGWAEGTKGQGQNYFISAGWKTGKSDFNFLLTGAPQWHDQNFNSRISDHYDEQGNFNIKHNGNWGLLNGEHFTSRRNYYHKPVANLNWELTLNDKSSLSTVLYGSWGRGGGSGGIGDRGNRKFTADGQWDFDAIVAANRASHASGGDGDEYVLRNSVNNHSWYGVVANYETILSDQLTWSIGTDLRSYRGSHFREVRDLLGASAYSQRANARFGAREITAEFPANPWSGISNFADKEDRIAYNNDETIRYAGLFSQLEFSNENFSGYVQGAVSNQNHVRFELFNETEQNEDSEKVSNAGYNLKGGFSINTGSNSNVFINTGYYQRQPFHDNIYLNFSNFVNPVTVPEKIFGLEAGYKYATRDFALNINAYRTSWKDRVVTSSYVEDDVVFFNTNQGVEQLHQGIVIDFRAKPQPDLPYTLTGFLSIGDWQYVGEAVTRLTDEDQNVISTETQDVDGGKVGDAAQFTAGLGIDMKLGENVSFDTDIRFYDELYSDVGAVKENLLLPSFHVWDAGLSYKMYLGADDEKSLNIRVNVNNVSDAVYLSELRTNIAAGEGSG
ncbi:MAG: TonB-dependent receptor, partial [Saprospiraceae bacterium]|nr:TonB-dependent receptor [Saprospiraceae bacterium]